MPSLREGEAGREVVLPSTRSHLAGALPNRGSDTGAMSTIFRVRCETCEVDGPKIRRSHSVTLCHHSITGPFNSEYHDLANDTWGAFLNQHEYHDLRLVTEG
jgi:hypothetical protein